MSSQEASASNARRNAGGRRSPAVGTWIPVGGIVLGVGYFLASLELPLGTLDRPGTGFYPRCVAVLLVGMSIVGLFAGDRSQGAAPGDDRAPWLRPTVLVAVIAFFTLAVTAVGYLVAATIVSLVCLTIMNHGGWVRRACYSIAISAVTYGLFAWLLAVPIPSGLPG